MATAAWAACGAWQGAAPLGGLAGRLDLVRAVIWYGFILHLFRAAEPADGGPRRDRLDGLFLGIGVVSALAVGAAVLTARAGADGIVSLASPGIALRLILALGQLLLLENLYRNTEQDLRWNVKSRLHRPRWACRVRRPAMRRRGVAASGLAGAGRGAPRGRGRGLPAAGRGGGAEPQLVDQHPRLAQRRPAYGDAGGQRRVPAGGRRGRPAGAAVRGNLRPRVGQCRADQSGVCRRPSRGGAADVGLGTQPAAAGRDRSLLHQPL